MKDLNLFGENLVEDVVGEDGETLLVERQPLGEEHVQIVWGHDVVLPLVRRPGQKEAEDLQSHQPSGLTSRTEQFEDSTDALLGVEGRHHGRRKLG